MQEKIDSGIDWVGYIPKNWRVLRNKHNFLLEKVVVGTEWEDTQLLSLTKNGIKAINDGEQTGKVPTSFATYQKVKKNDLVMCLFDLDCSAVFSGLSSIDGMISPAYKCFKCKSHIYPQYVDYYFQTVFEGRKYMRYSKNVRYSISADEFLSLPIIVPSMEEQVIIASFLKQRCEEIDELTSNIEKQLALLDEYRKSVITECVTRGIDDSKEMKDSGVAWCPVIPTDWTVTNPKAMFKLRNQKASEGERQLTASQEYGIIYQDDYMEITGSKVVTVEKDFSILKHVEPNDFVISMRSFQGGLEFSELSGSISSAYVMLIPDEQRVYPPFFRWFFKSSKYINAIQSTTNLVRDGQAMRYANFIKVPLFIIPMDEQKRIAEYLDVTVKEIDDIRAKKQEQLDDLLQYKKSMIFEYVTGKKEVPVNG